ncbi:unnamed protein product [Hymenolepis diminuta]|uniref:Uncharacterized protein n=1 Tax=Hymenolepis diminuta TaxID=6216 RepID=A0A564Z9Y3_HYMDI|nr:unnamed protein product [Hymenolepis diminuta]
MSSPKVSIINSLPVDTHTGDPSSSNASPVAQSLSSNSLFSLRLCTELCSMQPGLHNPWCSFSFIYCQLPTATNW